MTSPPSDGGTAYGVLALDGMSLALPLTVLREVIPAPRALLGLPVSAPGLLGAVELRDRVIPVLDLRSVVGATPAPLAGRVVAVVVHDGQVLGVLADAVDGITVVAPTALQRVAATGAALPLSHVFERPEDGAVCSLLDVSALFAVPGLPTLRETDAAGVFDGGPARVGSAVPVLTLRCGTTLLAVPAVDVHSVLPQVRLAPSPVEGGICRGTTAYGSVDVPAVDPLLLLGLGALPVDDGRQGIVLRLERGFVAVMVSEVIDIAPLRTGDVLAVPPLALRRPELFTGVTDLAGRQHLVLDAERLLAEPDLVALSGCNTEHGGPEQVGSAGPSAGSTYLTYAVGSVVATPLEQVSEILPFTPERAVLDSGTGAVLGMFLHRGEALPVVDLAAVLGSGQAPTSGVVLVVRLPGLTVGCLVAGLQAIEVARWEEPRDGTGTGRGTPGRLSSRPVVQFGPDTDPRMTPVVDLVGLLGEVFGVSGTEVPAQRRPEGVPADV